MLHFKFVYTVSIKKIYTDIQSYIIMSEKDLNQPPTKLKVLQIQKFDWMTI